VVTKLKELRSTVVVGGGRGGGGGEDLKAHKHLPAHSQPEHTEYTAYQDQRMTEIEKRLDKLEGK
jgi:hypothetical protein